MNNEQRDKLLSEMHEDVIETKTTVKMLVADCPTGARNATWSKALLIMNTAILGIIAYLHGVE